MNHILTILVLIGIMMSMTGLFWIAFILTEKAKVFLKEKNMYRAVELAIEVFFITGGAIAAVVILGVIYHEIYSTLF